MCLIIRQPTTSTPTYTLLPYTPLFRSNAGAGRPGLGQHRVHFRRTAQIVAQGDARYPVRPGSPGLRPHPRSEEHTSELQSLMRISYAVFCLKKKKKKNKNKTHKSHTITPDNQCNKTYYIDTISYN